MLRWLVKGMQNKEIADRLGVSTSTVNAHPPSIHTKPGVQNRVEAVRAGHARPAGACKGNQGTGHAEANLGLLRRLVLNLLRHLLAADSTV